MPKVSIVILTYNSAECIKACLESVFNQIYGHFEVIVVDNASSDSTISLIRKFFSRVILIENKKNFGACKAKNQAIEVACGEWILVLDCDVVLEDNFLGKIMEYVEKIDASIAVFQPKILEKNKSKIYSCGIFLTRPFRRFYDIGRGELDQVQFNTQGYIFGACSACALYKRQMLEEIKEKTGYFDERFFFLAEDVDLSWRAQRRGYKVLYIPEVVCYHSGNSSSTERKFRQFLCFRNRYYMIKKNEGLKRYYKRLLPLFYDIPRLIYIFFTNPYVFGMTKYKNATQNN